ncbi:MAG: peroxiredoxin, partial [Pseudomonadota bacterium]
TTEGQDFRDNFEAFKQLNCEIVGISRDNIKSHECFKEKMEFPFELLSDTDEKICKLFNVMKIKNMYGKQVRGIERSTFVLDDKGILRKEWRGVKVPGHVQEVLEFVRTL